MYICSLERLYAPPVLTQAARNQTILVGQTAKFSCEFLSDLHPSVYWMYFEKYDHIYNETNSETSNDKSVIYKDQNKIIMVRVIVTNACFG